MAKPIVLRNPWRWTVLLLMTMWTLTGAIVFANYAEEGDIPGVLLGVVLIALGVWFGGGYFRQAVILSDDEMGVRLGWSRGLKTSTARSDVQGVDLSQGRHDVVQYPTIYPVVTTSLGEVELTTLTQLGFGGRANRRVQRYVDTIRSWAM